MTDIRISLEQIPEPSKSIGKVLIDFYETMYELRHDPNCGGKRATKIIMTVSDIQNLLSEHSTKEQWISVEERLPEDYCRVLCQRLNDKGQCLIEDVCLYDKPNKRFIFENMIVPVRYWMPLLPLVKKTV